MEETADNFEKYVLVYFGLPSLLHSDNGTEFRNQCFLSLVKDMQRYERYERYERMGW